MRSDGEDAQVPMTIEFHCQQCDRLLRTSEDKAGATAKCPQCGAPVTVPNRSTAVFEAEPFEEDEEEFVEAPTPAAAVEPAKPRTSCPMCGENVEPGAAKCRACGEILNRRTAPPRVPTSSPFITKGSRPLEPGRILGRAWKIFWSQFGIAMAAVWLPEILAGFAAGVFVGVGEAAVGGNGQALPAVSVLMLTFVVPVVRWHLGIGRCIVLLKMVRGEPVDIGELFRGGRFLVRKGLAEIIKGILNTLTIMGLMVPFVMALMAFQRNQDAIVLFLFAAFGFSMLVLLMVMLKYWPTTYVLIDQDPPGTNCLRIASELTRGHRMTSFGLAILAGIVGAGGYLALCIGILFAVPIGHLMFTVAYCDLTGQPTVDEFH